MPRNSNSPKRTASAGQGSEPLDPFFYLSTNACWITTLDGRFRRLNPMAVAVLGPEADLVATGMIDVLHPDDRLAARAALDGLALGKPITSLESRFQSAGGGYAWFSWSSTLVVATGLAYTVAHNRTGERCAQEQSEARCACAFENTTDAFFAVDPKWRLIRINQQAERIWKCRREDVLSRNLWEVFPEAAVGPIRQLYEQAMQSQTPVHCEEFHTCLPHRGWFEIHAFASGDGMAVYFRDVTDRHNADEKFKRALQEKEVLLREVHHRVKNNLQVICSMLRLHERSSRDESLLQALRDCRERVMAMAMLHDQLHRAKDFSNINLGEYIRNLAASLFCSYGINSGDVDLRLDIEDIPVAVDTAIPCGLIVNELVSNSLRHAFPERRKGCVSLGLHARADHTVELTIADDGCGFLRSVPHTLTRSLGLWLVDLLADQIGAAVELSNRAGTQYRLVFQGTVGDTPPVE